MPVPESPHEKLVYKSEDAFYTKPRETESCKEPSAEKDEQM